MGIHKLGLGNLNAFLQAISKGCVVYALEQVEDQLHLAHADAWDSNKHVLGAYRPVEPLKSVVFRPRESLGAITDHSDEPNVSNQIVIGVKNCDLSALKIHDHVFLKSDPVDPYYRESRDKTLLVTGDCTDCCEVCFCTAVKEQPFAKEGFDINLSVTSKGVVVETGSEQGEQAVQAGGQYLEQADDSILQERSQKREALRKRIAEQAAHKGLDANKDLQKAVATTPESKLWEEFAEDCVECGACNLICCTCHCFLLADGFDENKSPSRIKQWDSCLYMNFARVAGGANPRKHRAERLYNRFDKKFNFFPKVLDTYACDGCGRCIEACTGKIDIREVLKKALDEG